MIKKDKEIKSVYRERDYGQGERKKGSISKVRIRGLIILLGYLSLMFHIGHIFYKYSYAAHNLMKYVSNNSIIYILLLSIVPFGFWMYSTLNDYWHFHQRKLIMLHLCVLNAILIWAQPIWTFSWKVAVQRIIKIKPGRNFTTEMIVELAKSSLLTPCGLFMYIILREYNGKFLNELNRPKIEGFRLQHIFDFRKNKNDLYDLRIMKDIRNGKDIRIEETDRFVHTFVLGASGTGKTSSVLEPMIIKDMNQKIRNRKKRVAEILQMIKDRKLYVSGPYNKEIEESNVKAYPKYEKAYSDLKRKYPDCGITFMAPNNDLNNRIVKAAKARGLRVNVIDPLKIYRDSNVNNLGINPFYVPLDADLYTQQEVITNTAVIFSEVLAAVNEAGGESKDEYFKNLNTSVTMNVATVCMLYASIEGKYTYLAEVQDCIMDFSKLQPMVEKIMKEFGLHITISEGNRSRRGDADRNALQNRVRPVNDFDEFIPKISEKAIPERFRNMTLDEYNVMLKDVAMGYKSTIYTILYELLGPGREKMEDQSRGLRNIISNLLQDPRINRILNAEAGHFINFDKILEKNEITVINTGLAISPRCSTALGLFFQLCLKISVLRRPEENRSMHFLTIDEASQYMHPMYEDMVALYRQYGVGVTIAMQATSQMLKKSSTRYLQDVVMGVGTHIVFGRTSVEEMELYSKLAGLKDVETVQKQINKTSIAEDAPQHTEGIRKSIEKKNVFEGSDIRNKDFQEITLFTVRMGRVLNPKAAKVAFVDEQEYYDQHVKWVDWGKLIPNEVKESIKMLPAAKKGTTVQEVLREQSGGYNVRDLFTEDIKTEYLENLPNKGEIDKILEERGVRKDQECSLEESLESEDTVSISDGQEQDVEIDFVKLLGLDREGNESKSDMESQLKSLNDQSNNYGLL